MEFNSNSEALAFVAKALDEEGKLNREIMDSVLTIISSIEQDRAKK